VEILKCGNAEIQSFQISEFQIFKVFRPAFQNFSKFSGTDRPGAVFKQLGIVFGQEGFHLDTESLAAKTLRINAA
jgi:hypothetical protein